MNQQGTPRLLLCMGCEKLTASSLADFQGDSGAWYTYCEACLQARQVTATMLANCMAWWSALSAEEQQGWHQRWATAFPVYRACATRELRSKIAGVYVVQLPDVLNCLKIGQSQDVHRRLQDAWRQYGKIVPLLIIPHTQPRLLESTVHACFARMRVYEGAGARELFCFDTRRKRKLFEQFAQEFSTCRVGAIQWQETSKTPSLENALASTMLPLFP